VKCPLTFLTFRNSRPAGSGEAWPARRSKEGLAVRDACQAVPAGCASSYQWAYTCQ